MSIILHIDMNSYFASVEQQANPRLRGKPIGVTGGDREERTVLATASIEAKKLGVKTGMSIWEAKKICPQIIIVKSCHDKYLSTTTKLLNIFKDYSPFLEVFSIDEVFLELTQGWLVKPGATKKCGVVEHKVKPKFLTELGAKQTSSEPSGQASGFLCPGELASAVQIAQEIKQRIRNEIGGRITCSIGISYNKLMAKLAGSLKKPDGLIVIPDQKTAIQVLDKVELDEICGIGPRIKKRLFNLGITSFKQLRKVPRECLLASFKSYGETLYNMARGIDESPILPFWGCEEVKSVGHRHTLDHNTNDPQLIRQILLKICEMIAERLRHKNLMGKTVHFWYRSASHSRCGEPEHIGSVFDGSGMQQSLSHFTNDGLEIFYIAWKIFNQIWSGSCRIRMVGASVSNIKPGKPINLSFLPEDKRKEAILKALDKVNNKFGDFTLQRAALLGTGSVFHKPNPFLSDRRFKI